MGEPLEGGGSAVAGVAGVADRAGLSLGEPIASTPAPPPSAGNLNALQGAALYLGAVLGTGAIALPALADAIAGPASLLAWIGLALLSAPLAMTFAALGSRYPDAGGVATFARLAFGDRAASAVGWCFYFAVPLGAPAAAMWAGAYVADAMHAGRLVTNITATALIVGVAALNAFGVRVTGRVQLALAALLVVFLLSAVALSLPSAHWRDLRPFAPHGWFAVAHAATLLVWCFVGWEAMTHLTAEFRRPARDVPRATAVAVGVVGVMYTTVAFAVIAVLGPAAADAKAPLGDLMAVGLGGNARYLAAAAALLLTLGTMNVYCAGAAKLGAALARDGALPSRIAGGSRAGEVPRRSLGLLSALALVVQVVVSLAGIGSSSLAMLTTGLFVAVYAVGVAAAVRLLPRRSRSRAVAFVALAVVTVLLVMAGAYLISPLIVAGGAFLFQRSGRRTAR